MTFLIPSPVSLLCLFLLSFFSLVFFLVGKPSHFGWISLVKFTAVGLLLTKTTSVYAIITNLLLYLYINREKILGWNVASCTDWRRKLKYGTPVIIFFADLQRSQRQYIDARWFSSTAVLAHYKINDTHSMFTGHLLHEFEGQRGKKTCFLKVVKKIKKQKNV